VQRRLLDLAGVDADLNRVHHRRKTLPELDEISEAERALREQRDKLVAAQTASGDLDRESKRLETEIDHLRAREKRDRALMDSSDSPKQVEDLQHELETLARRQGVLEDELLEVMERREAVDTDIERERAEVSKAEERLDDAAGRRDEATADLDSTEAKRTGERTTITGELPEELLALYERIRASKGIGAGPLQERRCGACRIELDRSALATVREAAPDDVVRCEECGAILVRSAGSGQ
jgi:predicted  nucleic acid-binding Zn-ribbon protein